MNYLKSITFITLSVLSLGTSAQSWEGTLHTYYRDSKTIIHRADITIKGDNYYIKPIEGGSPKYSAYIYNGAKNEITCLYADGSMKAVTFDPDKVMALYEQNKLLPGFITHYRTEWRTIAGEREIGGIIATHHIASDGKSNMWTVKVHSQADKWVPMMRLAGMWNQVESNQNTIVQATTQIGTATDSIAVSIQSIKVDDEKFKIPKAFQNVDISKLMSDMAGKDRLPVIVKSLVDF